jgi:hypothetical protein
MNTYLNAAVATDRQQQRIAAAAYRRSRTDRAVKANRRRTSSRRVSAFLKDLAAASL